MGSSAILVALIGVVTAAFLTVERILLDISNAVYLKQNPKYVRVSIHILLLAAFVVLFMYSGTFIAWFNYYIVKDTFNLGAYKVPRLWLSLFSVFLTSVVIVTITSYVELKNSLARFGVMELANTNWKQIWQAKEESVAKMNTNASIKIVIFLATVSFSIISTTQIGRYAEIGMIFIFPFILVSIIALLFASIGKSKDPEFGDILVSIVIERTKFCEACGEKNLFNSIFCTKCKNELGKEEMIVKNTIICPTCKGRSPEQSEFCRFCGNQLQETLNKNVDEQTL
jgi:hypothetical protein